MIGAARAAARGALLLALASLPAGAAPPRESAAAREALVRRVGGVEIDWSAGTLLAEAGAAADIRLPSHEVARPGAERRARDAALVKLRDALEDLPVAGKGRLTPTAIDGLLSRARTRQVSYQSNGGVLLSVEVAFTDLDPNESRAPRVVAVTSMPFELAPVVAVGERTAAVAHAVYRLGPAPRDAGATTLRRDRAGRLVLPASSSDQFDQLAGAPVMIYVQKVQR